MTLKLKHLKQLSFVLLFCFILTLFPAGLLRAAAVDVADEDELRAALENGEPEIRLVADITLTQPLILNGEIHDSTIDGSGDGEDFTLEFAPGGFIVLEEGASLMIKSAMLLGNSEGGSDLMIAVLEAQLTLFEVTITDHVINDAVDDSLTYRAPIEARGNEFGSQFETRVEIVDSTANALMRTGGATADNPLDEPLAAFLYVGPGVTARLDNVTVMQNEVWTPVGAAVVVESTANFPTSLRILDSRFTRSYGEQGGALYIDGPDSEVSVSDSEFKENRAEYYGAAIAQRDGSLDITGSEFLENKATESGGAIGLVDGRLSMENCQFDENEAPQGAAFFQVAGRASLTDTHFYGNRGNRGAAVYRMTGDFQIRDGEILNNSGKGDGGTLYFGPGNEADRVRIVGTHVIENNIAEDGAAVFYEGAAGALELGGSLKIKYNGDQEKQNLLLAEGCVVKLDDADPPTEYFDVHLSVAGDPDTPFTEGYGDLTDPVPAAELFTYDDPEVEIYVSEDGEISAGTPSPPPETYTLTLAWAEDFEVPEGAVLPPPRSCNAGDTVTPPWFDAIDGLYFEGWFESSDADPASKLDGAITVNEDVTLYGKWEQPAAPPADYVLSYAWIAEEAPAIDPPADATLAEGTVIAPPTPTAEGYTFEGWFYDADAETPFADGDTISAATTLYGLWSKDAPATVNISYTWADGPQPVDAFPPGIANIPTGDPIPQPELSSNYYDFDGWYEDKEGTTPLADNATAEQDMTVYGKWTDLVVVPVEYTITYAWGRGDRPDDVSLPPAETLEEGDPIPQPKLSAEGYDFKGWFEDKNGKTKLYANATAQQDQTVYAIWEKQVVPPTKYAITYAWVTGGEIPAAATLPAAGEIEEGMIIPAPDLTAKGFTFHGWYTDSVGKTKLPAGATAERDMTLYGKWTKDIVILEYTIAYAWTSDSEVPSGARLPETVTLDEGEMLPAPKLEVQDYTFHGWYTDRAGTQRVKTGALAEADMTLYGKWSKNPPVGLTVTFDMNGHGTPPAKVEGLAWGATIRKPAKPKADGWVFKGWYKDRETTEPWRFDSDTVTGDITLYARWHRASDPAELIAHVGELRVTLNNIRANDNILTESMVDRDQIHLRAEALDKLPPNITNKEVMGRGFYYVFDIGFERRSDDDRLIDRIDGARIEARVTISLGGQRDKEVDAYVLEREGGDFKLTHCPVIRTGDDYSFNGPHFSVYVLTFNAPGEKETTTEATTPEATTAAPTTAATTETPTTTEEATTAETTPLETVAWETRPDPTTKTMEAPREDSDGRTMVPLTTVFIILGIVILLLIIAVIALVVTRRE